MFEVKVIDIVSLFLSKIWQHRQSSATFNMKLELFMKHYVAGLENEHSDSFRGQNIW